MRALLVILLAFLAGCADTRPAFKPYTHRIVTPSGARCSATAVGKDRLLTAAHCLSDDGYVYLEKVPVRILSTKRVSTDNVVLTLDHTFRAWARRGASPQQGDAVQFFGNGEGFDQYYRRGYFSGWRDSYLLFDVMCGKGDSGAGLFNASGELVAVISAVYRGEHIQLCLAHPLGVI